MRRKLRRKTRIGCQFECAENPAKVDTQLSEAQTMISLQHRTPNHPIRNCSQGHYSTRGPLVWTLDQAGTLLEMSHAVVDA